MSASTSEPMPVFSASVSFEMKLDWVLIRPWTEPKLRRGVDRRLDHRLDVVQRRLGARLGGHVDVVETEQAARRGAARCAREGEVGDVGRRQLSTFSTHWSLEFW